MSELKQIGCVDSIDVRFCPKTRRFICLNERSVAIIDAFEAGVTFEDVSQAFSMQAEPVELEDIKVLWGCFTGTDTPFPSITTKVDCGSEETKGQAQLDKSGLQSYFVDCGTVNVLLYFDDKSSDHFLPHLRAYYEILSHDDNQLCSGSVTIVWRSDGYFEKHVDARAYNSPTYIGEFDNVFVELAKDLAELAIDYDSAVAVLHAATLVRGSRTLIFCNPSGSGKTTLSWLLANCGYELVHDDVLPIGQDGSLTQICTPSTLKEGSWEVLAEAGIKLSGATFPRNGTSVRFRRIERNRSPLSGHDRNLIFVNYKAGANAEIRDLTRIEVFKRLISEEFVIRNWAESNLRKLFDWTTSCRSCSLQYSSHSEAEVLINGWIGQDDE